MTVTVEVVPPNQITIEPSYVRVTAVAEQGPRGPAGPAGGGAANTWVFAGDGLLGGGQISSNVNLSVDSSVLRNTGVLTIDESNSRVGIGNTYPLTSLQVLTSGYSSSSLTTSSTSTQVLDTFASTAFRTAKYLVQVHDTVDNNYQASEILVLHNGTQTYVTEYGLIYTDSSLASFSADISAGIVRLLVTPTNAENLIRVSRMAIAV